MSWKYEQIIENAKRERKGDISIYRYYIQLLRRCPDLRTYEDLRRALDEIKKILDVEP